MSGSGSFGLNKSKVYGNSTTGPAITEHVLGDIAWNRQGRWMFCLMGTAVTQYDAGNIAIAIGATTTVATFTSCTTTTVGAGPVMLGVAQAAFSNGDYGWIWVGYGGGLNSGIKVRVAASCALGAKLYTTATAGVLDDSSTAGIISGLTITAVDSGSGSAIECLAAQGIYSNLTGA